MSAVEAHPRKRPVEYEATVVEVRMETHDTATLLLDLGEKPPEYLAGQFLNLDPHQFPALERFTSYLEDLKAKKEPIRSYSLTSAPHERYLAITVQDEEYVPGLTRYPPLLSPYLVHGRLTGARIRLTGFVGPYVLPDDVLEKTRHIVHVVAGSGSVPNFSIIKDALHRDLPLRHTVVYSNKTWEDVLFREPLEALERAHPDRLHVVHTLTREQDPARFSGRVREGRVTQGLLEELIEDRETCLVYACGPAITPWERRRALETRVPAAPRFLETVLGHLHALGIPDKRIKREAYG